MDYIFWFEILGTIAFAVSGAVIAIQKKMDILGVAMLGMVTAVGGGVLRDLILGITPPMAFRDPVYALLAVMVSIIVFLPGIRPTAFIDKRILFWMDTIGLGVFTVVGVRAGMPEGNLFLSVFVGAMTGVGGGIIRDLLAGNRPYIFIKHFYASASILGVLATALLWPIGGTYAMLIGMILVIVLRFLAARYRWSLPKSSRDF